MTAIDIEFTIIKGTYYCPWCEAAMADIKASGAEASYRVLNRDRLIEESAKVRMCTVPIIYHGVRLVGGYRELKNYLDSL